MGERGGSQRARNDAGTEIGAAVGSASPRVRSASRRWPAWRRRRTLIRSLGLMAMMAAGRLQLSGALGQKENQGAADQKLAVEQPWARERTTRRPPSAPRTTQRVSSAISRRRPTRRTLVRLCASRSAHCSSWGPHDGVSRTGGFWTRPDIVRPALSSGALSPRRVRLVHFFVLTRRRCVLCVCLEKVFGDIGPVRRVILVRDPGSGASLRYGFVK